MKNACTGVILAGGANNRFPGKKKAFRKVGDTVILEGIYKLFSHLFDEVILVVNDPKEFCGWDMNIVTDIDPSKCALSGIHAGLFYASNPYAFITACDTPFVNLQIIEYLVDQIESQWDIILPKTDDGYEPLSAVYSKACLPLIEDNLAQKIFMIKKFFRWKKVKAVPPEQLKLLDPDMRFYFNINTKEDLETANLMLTQTEKNDDN